MKTFSTMLLIFIASMSFAQNAPVEFNPETWKPPYSLPSPEGWDVERFQIPIEFAPSIPYTGVEDIRFTPGWGDLSSDQYWAYAFLWYLDGQQKVEKTLLETYLKAYYNGLVGRNIEPRKIPSEKVIPTKTSFTKIETLKGDTQTFSGTVEMLDYKEQKPMVLNCKVHVRNGNGNEKTFVFIEVAPQPFSHNVWKSLDGLWSAFHE